ncbi:MAG: toll/interleukin-1 receptor domain-containing protein, partial [Desulfobacterales bacterium]|nr:toll/interleukin-1 receptor domain-containing protein [Desulfobacterales bacterium]
MSKPTIFISYSHGDEIWKDRLRLHLGGLEKAGRVSVWHDRMIDPGGKWFPEINKAMESAAAAVCLISAAFLDSDFCMKEEIPYLLERHEKVGMVIFPILVRPCFWKAHSWIKETQMLPRDGKTVAMDYKDTYDYVFTELAEAIFNIIDAPDYTPPIPTPAWNPPEKVDIVRLPMTGAELFGRKKELELLDDAWESGETRVISLVAWGGVGKSTLVNKWLEKMGEDNYRGARAVFAWSFYSQGTGERVTSADQFIREALEWFGDPAPDAGSTWNKGKRLAGLVQKEKTLLI